LAAFIAVTVGLFMGARAQMDLGTLARWTFFPNPNHVVDSNIPDVLVGWSNGFWQIMQITILFFVGTHGMNGIRVVLEDYITKPFWKGLVRFVIFALWAIMLLLSIYVVLAS
jgi:succinate dehydrogenase hydrophobic anchor subunit